jgi:pSer/pThr/pTyr-binding forkhead associated (FHA) protein
MADPRLNSIHLDPARREEFRHARELLLGARGNQTQAMEQQDPSLWSGEVNITAVQNLDKRSAPGVKFVLMDQEYVYPLKIGLNTVGRMPDNDVVLHDPYVSRRHCAILVHAAGSACELHDVASKNGTFLNGRKINGPTPLQSGDEIRMCGKQLVFLTRDEAPEKPEPPIGNNTLRMD